MYYNFVSLFFRSFFAVFLFSMFKKNGKSNEISFLLLIFHRFIEHTYQREIRYVRYVIGCDCKKFNHNKVLA
jgi:hypothetical protein